jgi:hypothetical protein
VACVPADQCSSGLLLAYDALQLLLDERETQTSLRSCVIVMAATPNHLGAALMQ